METIISGIVGVVVGVAASSLVPEIATGTGKVLRGAAKEVIKGGIVIQEAASDLFSGTGGYFSDLVTEAKNELAAPASGEPVLSK
ncbi:MAG: hypothetical protein P0120_04530 [Nitrospira sp.]|nr:hypothetical protein [Nitrospira sp.]